MPSDHESQPSVSEDLARLLRRYALILECAGEGIYGLDQDGLTTFVNPAAAKMLGWEAIHHTRADGSVYPRETCPIYAAFKDGKVHRINHEVFWRKDRTAFPVEYVSTPIRDEAGELLGAVVTFNDITERKRQTEALEQALEQVQKLTKQLKAENAYLQHEIKLNHNFEEIIGESKTLTKVLHSVERVASTDATVLVLGETGVGKELFARAIHNLSPRQDRPLVKVNCAALPSALVESELFGHERGAFTGAVSQKIGRFELAHTGTIFLDEIAELPTDLQAKLLRVLQEGELERIGGTRTIKVDVRVIAATNRDLVKAVWAGEFRQDLYYRLNVFPVQVPPLRERPTDTRLLASHFVQRYARKLGRTVDKIPERAMERLERYSWPGNVRELENVIERAVILTEGDTLRLDDMLDPLGSLTVRGGGQRALEDVERDHIFAILNETGWKIQGKNSTAEILDLHPNTLRSRMKKLGIAKPVP